ncbi:putative disease resistance protein RGA3 [Chenopodium quinoa]|uniref:putative disease resistance protein RGA3 n=1 Tax=Chenopodium quinoa TaxID=63459 RepID=UPI000B76E1B2|nr:putative disease resistance protein RGA3 [Chenopodium quinoa]
MYEGREEWLKLKALLKIIGRKGSKVLATTRAKDVAKIMATLPTRELDGLSEVNSWALFKKMAFEPGQSQQKPHLVKVGKEIVRKCANVPLAIKTVGSLLYGKDEKGWLLLKDEGLASISQKQNSIIKILKLSYHNLWSPLKNCFAYCALFPKDFVFHKLLLMNLWMAEGFIVPTDNESQSLDEVAEDYFLMLLQRCFFQNIIRNEYGEIIFFRMHDLIHDLAREVAGVKCKVAKLGDRNFSNKIHHLSLDYQIKTMWKIPSGMLNLKLLRTFLTPQQILHGSAYNTTCSRLITNFRCLRVLDLGSHGVKSLPSSIDKLIHLRFLNLCHSSMEKLPETITELQNLQTLLLDFCLELKQLPTNIRKLTNLNTLSIIQCPSLTHIPSEIRELTSLHKLPHFIVGHKKNSEFKDKPSAIAELSDLKNLNNLKGSLTIELNGDLKDPALQAKEANLSSKQGWIKLNIRLKSTFEENEAVLEGLKPHPNLKGLNIVFYSEQKLPS